MHRKIIIFSFFIAFLFGCSTTRTYWGDWSGWSNWEKTNHKKEFTLQVNSIPSNAKLYINKKYVGVTPLKVRLPYPILRSYTQRHKYEDHEAGMDVIITGPINDILNLGRDVGPYTKKVDKEQREKFKDGTATYEFTLKKSGHLPLISSVTVPRSQTSVTLRLKSKPLLKISKVTINSNVKLTLLEKLYELFYDNRFSITYEKYDFEKMISKSKMLNEVFTITDSKHDLTLKISINIERDFTSIQARLLNRNNTTAATSSTNFPTKDFCDAIEAKLKALADSIAYNFLKL